MRTLLGRVIQPLLPRTTARGRLETLLAWLLLSLIVLVTLALILVLVVNPASSPRRSAYIVLIVGLGVFFAYAYSLNAADRYSAAAYLTVASAVLGPWGSVVLDPTVLRTDLFPLSYVTVSIVLSSILLPPLTTTLVAAIQMAVLVLVFVFSPAASTGSWPSFFSLVVATAVLSILSSIIRRRDLSQIEAQSDRLAKNEALQRELSIRDPLTELFNRRYLDETVIREVRGAQRSGEPIGVIILDIDHFKGINDGSGHEAGDAVLQALGRMFLESVRGYDIACRYGGDEFVLVLPGASRQVTRQRAESVRTAVHSLSAETGSLAVGSITISLGVAAFPDDGSTFQAVLKSADDALYRAKQAGRDRVGVAWET